MSDQCVWIFDEMYGKWDSDCGDSFEFWDGGPAENGFAWCPFCGKAISGTAVVKADDE